MIQIPSGIRLIPFYNQIPPAPWPAKIPSEAVVLGMDFSDLVQGAQIVNAEPAWDDTALSIVQMTWSGSKVAFVAAAGTPNSTATVSVGITLADGQFRIGQTTLPILAAGPSFAPGDDDMFQLQPVTTVGATAPGMITIPLPSFGIQGSSMRISGSIEARNGTLGGTASWDVSVLIEGLGTSQVTISQNSITSFAAPDSMAGAGVSVAASGSSVAIILTGVAGSTITWGPDLRWNIV